MCLPSETGFSCWSFITLKYKIDCFLRGKLWSCLQIPRNCRNNISFSYIFHFLWTQKTWSLITYFTELLILYSIFINLKPPGHIKKGTNELKIKNHIFLLLPLSRIVHILITKNLWSPRTLVGIWNGYLHRAFNLNHYIFWSLPKLKS